MARWVRNTFFRREEKSMLMKFLFSSDSTFSDVSRSQIYDFDLRRVCFCFPEYLWLDKQPYYMEAISLHTVE